MLFRLSSERGAYNCWFRESLNQFWCEVFRISDQFCGDVFRISSFCLIKNPATSKLHMYMLFIAVVRVPLGWFCIWNCILWVAPDSIIGGIAHVLVGFVVGLVVTILRNEKNFRISILSNYRRHLKKGHHKNRRMRHAVMRQNEEFCWGTDLFFVHYYKLLLYYS